MSELDRTAVRAELAGWRAPAALAKEEARTTKAWTIGASLIVAAVIAIFVVRSWDVFREVPAILLVIVAAGAAVALLSWLGVVLRRRRYRILSEALNWPRLANLRPGWIAGMHPVLGAKFGRYDGRFHSYQTGGSKSPRVSELVLYMKDANPIFQMRIEREGIAARIAKAFGGQDLEFNDPAFDGKVRVQTNNEQYARSVLDAITRERLLSIEGLESIQVDAGFIAHVWRREETRPDRVRPTLDVLARVADQIARHVPGPRGG